ncbi:MAG TPA: hypothetical protein ENK85_05380, partial [Saprospiraceae bacterium]|nr:hypothetical protein [Saprospiraceae bacterium]
MFLFRFVPNKGGGGVLVFGALPAVAFGLWSAASCFWSLGRSKLLLVFGAQQAAFGLWGAASCF